MSTPNQRSVLLLGASSSIGRAIANRFTRGGCHVVVTYNAKMIREQEMPGLTIWQLDLSNDEQIRSFAGNLEKVFPTLDIVIFLAGVLPGKDLVHYSFDEIDKVMSINFNGQAKLASMLMPLLNDRSRVLLFSSISGQRGSFDPIYAASKGALLSFVKSMAGQIPRGATINAIAPGLIQGSSMFEQMSPDRREHHRQQSLSGRLLSQDDLAEVVFDLCSDHWKHLNGACIDLNGGQYVR